MTSTKRTCALCEVNRPALKRPKTGQSLCRECFFLVFEEEVHNTISTARLFQRGQKVAIAASGGKDSTVLAYVMKLLNDRHDYGLDLCLLSVDEGITGYRDDSLETVKRNEKQYGLPLKIVSYEELYGWSMDAIVRKIGKRNNCTFCGVFRRQALDRGAALLRVDHIVTGHNADDIAETVLMNFLRGDIARLGRCTAISTNTDARLPRSKPFKYTYEKEIVMYAYFKGLDYFTTECIYSPEAYRGYARTFIKDLETIRPTSILDIIHSGEAYSVKESASTAVLGTCERCGYMSSRSICKALMTQDALATFWRMLRALSLRIPHRRFAKMASETAASIPQLSPEEMAHRRFEIEENLKQVRERVLEATRARTPLRDTRLVAVSKTKPASDVQIAYDVGQRHFGENYVQELVGKAPQLPADIQWHFIGHLQSNKCKMLADIPNLAVVETIDSPKLATMMDKACSSRPEPMGVFIQVNTSGEPQKGGVEPEELAEVARHIVSTCSHLKLLGLMTIGMLEREETPNPDFLCLADCRSKLLEAMPELGELELSMGMSSDFAHAIELGSTNVRVGSTIFGARQRVKQ